MSCIRVLSVFTGSMLVISCSAYRPENPEYFSKVTDLSICKSANIKNFQYGKNDYSSDPTYAVQITADKPCLDRLTLEVSRAIDKKCGLSGCFGQDGNMDFIQVERISADRMIFVKLFT